MSKGKAASTNKGILGESESKDGKLDLPGPLAQPPKCPECGSLRVWKDGVRYPRNNGEPLQRWLCRLCGYRFSQPNVKVDVTGKGFEPFKPSKDHTQTPILRANFSLKKISDDASFPVGEDVGSHNASITEKGLNILCSYSRKRRVCVLEGEAKNLAEVETAKNGLVGATKLSQEDIKGLITQYMAYLEKEGYCQDSAYPNLIKRLVRVGANIGDPEDVKSVIARQPWKESVKLLAVCAYDIMVTQILKTKWNRPQYTPQETTPFVPEEKELEQLIAACKSRRMAAYLQTLKETFADPGEALRLCWIDVDSSNNVITINHPVKGHASGQIKVTTKLIAMLNSLPKTSERVFPTTYLSMRTVFRQVRKRAAQNLQNPRLLAISFKTFRHWGGTMLAHYTHGNVLTVQRVLRHKSIQNTMKYIHMIAFKDDEFDVATATTVEEIKQLASAGFEKFDEMNGIHVYRRPKRFNA